MSERTSSPAVDSAGAVAAPPRVAALRRWWRRLRPVVYLAAIAWLAWGGYLRIVTPTAAEQQGRGGEYTAWQIPPELATLNSELQATGTPPPLIARGFRSLKDWVPQWNSEQAAASAFVAQANVSAALDRIVRWYAIHPDSWESDLRAERVPGLRGIGGMRYGRENWGAEALAVRARARRAGGGDAAASAADLSAAARYAADCNSEDFYLYSSGSLEPMALDELSRLARETPLPGDVARRTIAELSAGDGLSPAAMLIPPPFRRGVDRGLDYFYTDDGRGGGWVVLSSVEFVSAWNRSSGTSRWRAWNLLSPVFFGRREARSWVMRQLDALRRFDRIAADELPTERDEETSLAAIEEPSVLLGPLCQMQWRPWTGSVVEAFAHCAQRRIAIVHVALSAYRHDRGAYPAALAEVVPDFLSEIPIDLLSQSPFVYRRDGDGYRLGVSHPPSLSGQRFFNLTVGQFYEPWESREP